MGFVGVEVAAPDLPFKVKIFAVTIVACAIAMLWIVPVLLVTMLGDKKRIKAAQEALANGDMQTVFDQLQPMTGWTTCSQLDRGNLVLDLLGQMYDRGSQPTSIEEIAQLHRQYFAVYNAHKDSQGIVHDDEISDELDRTFQRARALAAQLPPPTNAT